MVEMLIMRGKADEQAKACDDCKHCKGSMSWWCTNEDAICERGTSIPGVSGCPHWEAATYKEDVSWVSWILPGNKWLKIYLDKETK